MYRDYKDFYIERTDLSTGRVADSFGTRYDLTLIELYSKGAIEKLTWLGADVRMIDAGIGAHETQSMLNDDRPRADPQNFPAVP